MDVDRLPNGNLRFGITVRKHDGNCNRVSSAWFMKEAADWPNVVIEVLDNEFSKTSRSGRVLNDITIEAK